MFAGKYCCNGKLELDVAGKFNEMPAGFEIEGCGSAMPA